MRTLILAGGMGTRLEEETTLKPKPMVEIGGHPILWHIMHGYATYGFKEFVVALGYKGDVIKEYFINYHARQNDLSVNLGNGSMYITPRSAVDWVVHLVDTGLNTQTGGRVKQLAPWMGRETFMLTYGDGVANINIRKLLEFHRSHGKLATVTAVQPPARFGGLHIEDTQVTRFIEKPPIGEGWVSGGFFVLEPGIFDYIDDVSTVFEREPLERLVAAGQLMTYQHPGFWQCMDTIRDVRYLNDLWRSGDAPWKVWNDIND